MSDPTTESAGTVPESLDSSVAPPGQGLQVTQSDILVASSAPDDALAALPESPAPSASVGGADTLNLSDVLSGADAPDPNLGAYLKFETVNGNTVVSVDADGMGGAPAVAVVTLEGVTGLTLQQLLQNDNGVG